jgi:tetratricopeptide (TPR) repeat protein
LFYSEKGGSGNARKSLDYFNQAIALDRNFALAYAGIAEVYRNLGANSVIDPKEASSKAKAAAMKALELDETLAEAHVALANTRTDDWDWTGAERDFKRAIELNPNLAIAHHRYSQYLPDVERFPEALAESKRAQELDPLRVSLKGQEGIILYYARRNDEAIQILENTIKLEPDNVINHTFLAYAYTAKGRYAESIEEYKKAINIGGESTSVECYMGETYALSGKRDEALAILGKLKSTKDYVSPYELAALYAGLRDKEATLQSLERAYTEHDLQLQYLKIDPDFDFLRSDPRYADLIHRVGLSQ